MGNKKPMVQGTPTQWEPRCPNCRQVIGVQATVEAFGEPKAWHFWGSVGERWKLCEGDTGGHRYVHFKALVNGRISHRLAWLEKAPAETVVQEALL